MRTPEVRSVPTISTASANARHAVLWLISRCYPLVVHEEVVQRVTWADGCRANMLKPRIILLVVMPLVLQACTTIIEGTSGTLMHAGPRVRDASIVKSQLQD